MAIRTGNSTHWDFMFEKFKSATLDSDIQKYLTALSASEDQLILANLLNKTIDLTEIRLQDVGYIYGGLCSNKVGRHVIMDWMTNSYQDIFDTLGANTILIASVIIDGYAGTSNTQSDIDNITNFVHVHQSDLQSVMSSIDSSLKMAHLMIDWNEMHRTTVHNWLNTNYATTQLRGIVSFSIIS